MARTQQDIQTQIEEQASKYPELAELESNKSKVAVWNCCKKVMAFAIHYLERLFDELKQERNLKKKILHLFFIKTEQPCISLL